MDYPLEGYDDEGRKYTDHVMLTKIENGYLIETCCSDAKRVQYIKELSLAPSIVSKMMKTPTEVKDLKVDESKEKMKNGSTKIKIKVTK